MVSRVFFIGFKRPQPEQGCCLVARKISWFKAASRSSLGTIGRGIIVRGMAGFLAGRTRIVSTIFLAASEASIFRGITVGWVARITCVKTKRRGHVGVAAAVKIIVVGIVLDGDAIRVERRRHGRADE